MAIEAVVGKKLFTFEELDDVERREGGVISDFLDDKIDTVTLEMADGRNLDHLDLKPAHDAASSTVPFTGIGPGKPLTMVIETVYVGDYPDTLKFVPGRNQGDILVSSAHKAFQEVSAAQRAVHLLQPSAERNSYLEFKATSTGSRLVHYSPAVTDLSVQFTFELSADRDFESNLGESLKKALTGAAALPIFAPAAPYLVVASGAVPIAEKAAEMLARPRPFYEQGVEINLSRPGLRRTQACALVLYPGIDRSPFAGKYETTEGDWVLRDKDGNAYDGPLPYVVVSVDGAERSELAGWSAQAASATLLERFFKPDAFLSKALDIATEGMTLYNDALYRDKAADALKAAKDATGPAQHERMAQFEAYLKNIRDDDIRESVRRKKEG